MVLGVALLVVCFLLLRMFFSGMPVPSANTNTIVLPAQNPYTFSTSSPLLITRTTQHVTGMGTLVNYSGSLPAIGSCQAVSVQTPTYAKNPVRFAFIVNTTATSSCADSNKPQTFSVGFGADSAGNTPVLSAVFVNGTKVIYTVNGN